MIRSSDADAPDLIVYLRMFRAASGMRIRGTLCLVPGSCNFARLIVGSVLARVNTVHKEV